MMQYELAPMEGLTTYIYRNAYEKYYGGIDTYYTPFISLHRDKALNFKELRELEPANNHVPRLVPQVLTSSASDFLKAAEAFRQFGYEELNLNFGCPSGTVAPKKKGAGILTDPEMLDHFLEQVFEATPVAVSVKTRIGFADTSHWEPIFQVYAKYPLTRLIVHPRCREDYYRKDPDPEAFRQICDSWTGPAELIYNGNVFTAGQLEQVETAYPKLAGVMLGRGILAYPGMLQERLQRAESIPEPADRDRLIAFHDEIYAGYLARPQGAQFVTYRMKELWFYLEKAFVPAPKQLKALKKAGTPREYLAAAHGILRDVPWSEDMNKSIHF